MIDKLKNIFKKKQQTTEKSAKDLATEKGEPYIQVLDTNVDPKNPKYGYFELDWNKHFVDNLNQPSTLWIIFSMIGVVTIIGLILYNKFLAPKKY